MNQYDFRFTLFHATYILWFYIGPNMINEPHNSSGLIYDSEKGFVIWPKLTLFFLYSGNASQS